MINSLYLNILAISQIRKSKFNPDAFFPFSYEEINWNLFNI